MNRKPGKNGPVVSAIGLGCMGISGAYGRGDDVSTTSLSISEIAFELGFEQLSSFNKLFRSKTNLSPLEFRQSFN